MQLKWELWPPPSPPFSAIYLKDERFPSTPAQRWLRSVEGCQGRAFCEKEEGKLIIILRTVRELSSLQRKFGCESLTINCYTSLAWRQLSPPKGSQPPSERASAAKERWKIYGTCITSNWPTTSFSSTSFCYSFSVFLITAVERLAAPKGYQKSTHWKYRSWVRSPLVWSIESDQLNGLPVLLLSEINHKRMKGDFSYFWSSDSNPNELVNLFVCSAGRSPLVVIIKCSIELLRVQHSICDISPTRRLVSLVLTYRQGRVQERRRWWPMRRDDEEKFDGEDVSNFFVSLCSGKVPVSPISCVIICVNPFQIIEQQHSLDSTSSWTSSSSEVALLADVRLCWQIVKWGRKRMGLCTPKRRLAVFSAPYVLKVSVNLFFPHPHSCSIGLSVNWERFSRNAYPILKT